MIEDHNDNPNRWPADHEQSPDDWLDQITDRQAERLAILRPAVVAQSKWLHRVRARAAAEVTDARVAGCDSLWGVLS